MLCALSSVGNEWEPAENEHITTSQVRVKWGGALVICYNILRLLYPCDLAAPISARYNQSKQVGWHPQCLVWSEMSGNLLRMNTLTTGQNGGCTKYAIKPVRLCRLWPGGARSDWIQLIQASVGNTHICLVQLKMSGNLLKMSTFQPGKMGGALIRCNNKPVRLCRLWPGGARSGLIQSIQECWATPTVLGLVGNEWELA